MMPTIHFLGPPRFHPDLFHCLSLVLISVKKGTSLVSCLGCALITHTTVLYRLLAMSLERVDEWLPWPTHNQTKNILTFSRTGPVEVLPWPTGSYIWKWFHARGLLIAQMMEAGRTSEKFVIFYQTIRSYNAEDCHLRTHRLEKVKSYWGKNCLLEEGYVIVVSQTCWGDIIWYFTEGKSFCYLDIIWVMKDAIRSDQMVCEQYVFEDTEKSLWKSKVANSSLHWQRKWIHG
jgi:hypothetical protein